MSAREDIAARFRADSVIHPLLDAFRAEVEHEVCLSIAEDFKTIGKTQDVLSWGEAHNIAIEGVCACRGGSKPCKGGDER